MATAARSALTDEIRRVSELAQLEVVHWREATGADDSSVRRWLRGVQAPVGERAERALELVALVQRLERVMTPSYVGVWVRLPIEQLGDRRPLDLIRTGSFKKVSRVVASLEGNPVA